MTKPTAEPIIMCIIVLKMRQPTRDWHGRLIMIMVNRKLDRFNAQKRGGKASVKAHLNWVVAAPTCEKRNRESGSSEAAGGHLWLTNCWRREAATNWISEMIIVSDDVITDMHWMGVILYDGKNWFCWKTMNHCVANCGADSNAISTIFKVDARDLILLGKWNKNMA